MANKNEPLREALGFLREATPMAVDVEMLVASEKRSGDFIVGHLRGGNTMYRLRCLLICARGRIEKYLDNERTHDEESEKDT